MIWSANRPFVYLGAATATAVVCALGLRWAQAETFPSVFDLTQATAPAVIRSQDGHYWAEAMVEGRPMRMLVDTGASVVTLGRVDAERAGLNLRAVDYTQTLQTAGGPIKAAPVVLSSLVVGGVKLRSVDAVVVDADLPAPLLGMSYLGRLSGFEAGADGLRLKG